MSRNLLAVTLGLLVLTSHGRVHADLDDAARTADLSKRFSYQNVTSSDANELFAAMKITTGFNPKSKLQNPDPEWIPGWNALSLTDETRTAILQAAINRTWTKRVHDDYTHYREAWAAIGQQLRPELERVMAMPGYYDRATALAKLFADVQKAAAEGKVLYPAGNQVANAGFLNGIVRAMVDVHHQARCDVLLPRYFAKLGVNLADFETGGRPFADEAVERDLFTRSAEKLGDLAGAPPLAKLREYGKAFEAVKWPTSRERAEEITKARQQLIATNANALKAAVPGEVHALLGGGGPDDPIDPKLRWVAGGNNYSAVVVTRAGRSEVELISQFKNTVPYDCKLSGRLDAQGAPEQVCKYRDVSTSYAMQVKVAELPAGLELRKGDEVELWADLESKKETKTKVDYQLTARALVSVKRDGKTIAMFW